MSISENIQSSEELYKDTKQLPASSGEKISAIIVIGKIMSAIERILGDGFVSYATAYCGLPIHIRVYDLHSAGHAADNAEFPDQTQGTAHAATAFAPTSDRDSLGEADSGRAMRELSTYMSYPGWSGPAAS
jgi:hypothetical protein